MRMGRRKTVAVAATALASLALAATTAANGVTSGELALEPDQATFEGFADMGIAVEAKGAAGFTGGAFVFPATGGDIDPNAGYQGIIGGAGALKFTRATDGAKLKFKNPAVAIRATKAVVTASVRKEVVKVAKVTGYDIAGNDKSFQLKDGKATLSRSAAKALKDTFDFPFRRGIPLGTFEIKAKLTKGQVQE